MTSMPGFFTRRPNEGRRVGVVGDVYRFLATGDDTDGQYALWEAIVPPGGGPPPHTHSREVEFFHVLEGQITFQVDDQKLVAEAGWFAHIPIGTTHAFKNESEFPAKMLIGVSPAGLENMFFDVGQPMKSSDQPPPPPGPDEIEKLLEVAPKYGVEIKAPPHA